MLFILSSFRSCGRGLTRICLIWENDGGSGWDGAKKGRESIPQTHVCTVEGGRGRGHVFMWVSKARWLSFRNAGIARSATALNRAHFVDDLSFAHLSLSLSLSRLERDCHHVWWRRRRRRDMYAYLLLHFVKKRVRNARPKETT